MGKFEYIENQDSYKKYLRVKMRILQLVLFSIGVLAFLSAAFFIGTDDGNSLWKIGIAMLLLDVVCIQLWPAKPKHN
jgi:membrane protein YdbS with pleckstrin-like domain